MTVPVQGRLYSFFVGCHSKAFSLLEPVIALLLELSLNEKKVSFFEGLVWASRGTFYK